MSLEQPEPKPVVVGYLVVQGAAVFGWWTLLFFVEATRGWFVPEGGQTTALVRSWLPQVLLFGLGVPGIPSGGWVALAVFGLAGCLGMWSGATMAGLGRGTPLPTATASALVIAGPYRWVRNPMAVAGITQGIVVAWWMGTASYIALSVLGGAIWHVFVRPSEEADLVARFGASYRAYRTRVGLWLPWLFRSSATG